MVFLHHWTDSWDPTLFPLCLVSDAASERVKAVVWTGKNNIFCRVTTLARAVCHMSKICETRQMSVEAALLLVACSRNLHPAALTPSHGCSLRGWYRTTSSAQENQLRAVFRVRAACGLSMGWDSPPHCCVGTPGASPTCARSGVLLPAHPTVVSQGWEVVRQV